MSILKKTILFALVVLFLTSITSCRATDCDCPKFELGADADAGDLVIVVPTDFIRS